MTNKQFLIKQMVNMSDEELAMELPLDCERFEFKKPECDGNCQKCKINWLKSEHKEPIKLSDAERVILENIDKNFVCIGKNEKGEIYFQYKNGDRYWADIFDFEMFKFIKEDTEPYNIEELLKCK